MPFSITKILAATLLAAATATAQDACQDSCVTKMANANLNEVVLDTIPSGWMTRCDSACSANPEVQTFSCEGNCDLMQRIELCKAPKGKKWGMDIDLTVSSGKGHCSLRVCTPLVNQDEGFECSSFPGGTSIPGASVASGTAVFRGPAAAGGVTITPMLRMHCDKGMEIEVSWANLILV